MRPNQVSVRIERFGDEIPGGYQEITVYADANNIYEALNVASLEVLQAIQATEALPSFGRSRHTVKTGFWNKAGRQSKGRIIAAFAGTGKTTYAAAHPDSVIDFVAMPFKYHLDLNNDQGESGKANPDNQMRWDWPMNYVKAIVEELARDDADGDSNGNGKTILIPSDARVLRGLKRLGVAYTLVYPRREDKEMYRQRFIERGNSQDFLDVFIGGWDGFMDVLEADTFGERIILEAGQFLGDVVE